MTHPANSHTALAAGSVPGVAVVVVAGVQGAALEFEARAVLGDCR